MALAKVTSVAGKAVYVPGDDIDTDRIIPARFMKCVTFDGLGVHLFHDVRWAEDGSSKNHPIDDPRHKGATILISNNNFGCGSSREHAPQALAKHGIRAVIAEGFAEIFFGNSTTLGMPCVALSHAAILELATAIEKNPDTQVTIDLESQTVKAGALALPFSIKSGAKDALVRGEWDPIGQLLDAKDKTRAVADRLAYLHF